MESELYVESELHVESERELHVESERERNEAREKKTLSSSRSLACEKIKKVQLALARSRKFLAIF